MHIRTSWWALKMSERVLRAPDSIGHGDAKASVFFQSYLGVSSMQLELRTNMPWRITSCSSIFINASLPSRGPTILRTYPRSYLYFLSSFCVHPCPSHFLSFCISKLLVKKRLFLLEILGEERCSEQGCWHWRLEGSWVGRAGGIFLFPMGISTHLNVLVRTS